MDDRRETGSGGGTVPSGTVAIQSSLSLADTLRPFIPRFGLTAVYFAILFTAAATGYRSIEGWSWFESYYMAITTVTSVGYMEVHPLSPAGRSFTAFVLFFGVTGLGIYWALITALIVELDLGGVLRRRRKMKELADIEDHYIVCGAGRVGQMVITELRRAGVPVVAVEIDPDSAQAVEEGHSNMLVLCADATKERTLDEAGIGTAKGLAACLEDDGDNLLICLTARDLTPSITVVARASDEESMRRLERAGADHVISPTHTGGVRMATTLLRPNVLNFLDSAIVGGGMDLRLEEATIPEGSPLAGRTLGDASIAERTGLVVIALQARGSGGGQTYNPGPETSLAEGDVMIVLGKEDQVQRLREYAASG